MPKRKAFEPVDSSDGDDDDYRHTSYVNHSSNKKYSSSSVSVSSTTFNFAGIGSGSNNSILQSNLNLTKPGPSNSNSILHGNSSILQSNLAKPAPNPLVSLPSTNLSSPVAVKKTKKLEFAKRIKNLNQAFISACRATTGTNPSHSLVPLVRDYLYHSRVIMEEFQDNSAGDNNVAERANGVSTSSSLKSFRSLGEFFEDFEVKFVQPPKPCPSFTSASYNSAAASKDVPVKHVAEGATFKSVSKEVNVVTASTFKNTSTISPMFPTSSTQMFPSSSTPTSSFHSFNTMVKAPADQSKIISAAESTVSIEPKTFPSSSFMLGSRSPSKNVMQNRPSTTSRFSNSKLGSPPPPPVEPLKTSDFLANPGRIPMPPPVLKQTAAGFSGFSFFTKPMQASYGAGVPTISSSQPEQTNSADADDEDDDEPPKPEVIQVTEDDAVYSTRCKVFGVIDGKYKDKGVGVLYIKKLEGDKHQVVVRADNNLGTVILNILLQKSLPVDKKSAKDIMTMDFLGNNKKGMPILLRTKSEKEGNELFEKLKEFQMKTT